MITLYDCNLQYYNVMFYAIHYDNNNITAFRSRMISTRVLKTTATYHECFASSRLDPFFCVIPIPPTHTNNQPFISEAASSWTTAVYLLVNAYGAYALTAVQLPAP